MKIYRIVNKITGKSYIGQTSILLSRRFAQHFDKSCKGRSLFKDGEIYGIDNFSIEELFDSEDPEELDLQERKFIHEFNSIIPYGYNTQSGGFSGFTFSASEESKSKNSISHTLTANRKKVLFVNTGEIVEGSHKACKIFHIRYNDMLRICNTGIPDGYGRLFKWI